MNFNKNSLGNAAKPVIWNYQFFSSGAELRKHLNVSNSTVSNAIRLGSDLKGYKVMFAAHYNAKPIVYENKHYPSMEELARQLKTSPQLLRYYLKNDKPFGGSYLDYVL